MSLLDNLNKRRESELQPHVNCRSCQWINKRTPQERKAISDWLTSGLSVQPLWEELHKAGLPVKLSAFRGHIRECVKGKSDDYAE